MGSEQAPSEHVVAGAVHRLDADKLQMVGLTTGYDQVVVRGDRAQGAFSAFCYKAGQLVGIESVNRAGDHMFGRRLLAAHGSITPEQAADSSFDLKSALS